MNDDACSGVERAVVDRIEEGCAVLLVGDDEVEHHLDAAALPEGAGEGALLRVRIAAEGLEVLDALPDAQAEVRADAEERLRRLRRRGPGSRRRD